MPSIDFWFSIGSTYTYLTVMRLPDVAKRAGLHINWRPFDVRRIMVAQQNIPFRGKPQKEAYMWRDIERRAAALGLKPALPAPYPLENLALANQVAIIGESEGWCTPYTQETYRRWFHDGEPAGSEPNLSASLRAIGQDPDQILEQAMGQTVIGALESQTTEAQALGVFGAPSFVVGNEVFWGDDRLDDAIAWCRHSAIDSI
ncbi:MAG: DsbA family protein [Pararhodobacter sp.]